ncbi:MAG: biotin/lipoyl-containing protein, partial [Moorella sp. (in: firmicutes)]
MATRVVMPQVGITTTEGLIGEWYKQEGEYVKKGEPLFSIETDKVTTDVEATADGILRKIIVPAGKMAPVTSIVAIIGEPDEDIGPLLGAAEIETTTTTANEEG